MNTSYKDVKYVQNVFLKGEMLRNNRNERANDNLLSL